MKRRNMLVATRTNALWQRVLFGAFLVQFGVATRTNALWQSSPCLFIPMRVMVATRTNALRQSRAIVVPEPEAPKI